MSYLNITTSFAEIKGGSIGIAKKEKADCMVRALAAAAETTYNISHKFCADVFGRKSNTGTDGVNIHLQMMEAEENGLTINGLDYNVKVMTKSDTHNRYKLKGDIIWRKKTLKSFVESHQKGSYIVLVANHALTIKDGELVDWNTMKFKPTRKVLNAYKIEKVSKAGKQLNLFE
jgi:hypothetical protein|tara:strand:- start:178 stop:699 length:522 start_codon:yes stop_codon:yes gene_type:complete